ncbi:MAG: Swt1 family HEPN domain-containing protein [Dehalococcoidales bacterium]
MAITNYERVGKALETLKAGLKPFFEREMKSVHGGQWTRVALQSLSEEKPTSKGGQITWDVQAMLHVMWDQWNDVFRRTLGPAERSLISELRDMRNKWAHQNPFSTDDAYRCLDSIGRLLQAVAAEEADEIDKQKMELLRTRFDEQRRGEMRKVQPMLGQPVGGLKPWREVVTPHPDVASGRYQQAEFAADLWQVYLDRGSEEYRNPTEFYRRTFLTGGLIHLLTGALGRLGGTGGDPVVELQTNFGGGKTHSMLALYHLFSGKAASELPGVEGILKDSGLALVHDVHRVVLVGSKISPGQPHRKADGVITRTLWGEIAWQLGGKDGYSLIAEADQSATNPGDRLRELFQRYSPCLILIDEWVAYARQLHDDPNLPAGTFDTQFTFAQALTEATKAAPGTMLVVSIPASDNEIGGERGKMALDRLKNTVGRVESSWRPASTDEGFEIVRRRLFEPIVDNSLYVQRDAVARAFTDLYATQSQEFPYECREADYERRLKAAYPIHPELFDRLYTDWSALDKFQRTRGVLRLMAAVIHSLWIRNDTNLLILPASIPIDDPAVQFELTRYLEDQWVPVIEKDVDGPQSLPLTLDRDNPNLGRYSACRRVARTVYIGSAPTLRGANRGIDERRIKLGCVQPGESVPTFGDALRRLTDQATYLYVDGNKYWYSTQPSVTRLADDRAAQLANHAVLDEIRRRLRGEARTRAEFARVHVCVPSGDIPDELEARLVILDPEYPHISKDQASPARTQAASILENRGNSPRNYKNMLVFLAADGNRLKELDQSIRQYLAWTSIIQERETLNLDAFQAKQAETKSRNADETVKLRIPETYQWLLVPGQSKPQGVIEWTEMPVRGQEALSTRAAKRLKSEEMLLVQIGATRLRLELDRVPLWRGDNVSIKQLVEDFGRYLYLPRIRDSQVIVAAIADGVRLMTWNPDSFAFAESWDQTQGRYKGLSVCRSINVLLDGQAMLVKPEVAQKHIEEDQRRQPNGKSSTDVVPGGMHPAQPSLIEPITPAEMVKPKRFHATIQLDPTRLSRDIAEVADEVVQHLVSLPGASAETTLEIQISIPDGASEQVIRTVTENCRTLGFSNFNFEKE